MYIYDLCKELCRFGTNIREICKKYNKDVDFYIVVADEYGKEDSVVNDKNILIAHEFLNIDENLWTNMAFKYNLTEFCTCIKPFSIEYFFVQKGYDTVCYLDPDIYLLVTLVIFMKS